MIGWYAVQRGITAHHLFKGRPDRLAVWMWLMDNAVWKDTTHDVQGHTVSVARGSVCASSRHISLAVGVGHQVVRTSLKRFEDELMTNTKLTHGKSIISLCNFEKYQDPNMNANTQPTQDQHKTNTQKEQGNKGTKKQESLEKEDVGTSLQKKRGARLADDWFLPMDWGQWAVSEGWTSEQVKAEAEKFKDYWISKPGAAAVKLDWQATWRNWIRNSNGKSTGTNAGRNSGRPNPHRSLLAAFGANATDDDGAGSDPSGNMRDVTPASTEELDGWTDSNPSSAFLRFGS
jgi:hypothetical protein